MNYKSAVKHKVSLDRFKIFGVFNDDTTLTIWQTQQEKTLHLMDPMQSDFVTDANDYFLLTFVLSHKFYL